MRDPIVEVFYDLSWKHAIIWKKCKKKGRFLFRLRLRDNKKNSVKQVQLHKSLIRSCTIKVSRDWLRCSLSQNTSAKYEGEGRNEGVLIWLLSLQRCFRTWLWDNESDNLDDDQSFVWGRRLEPELEPEPELDDAQDTSNLDSKSDLALESDQDRHYIHMLRETSEKQGREANSRKKD